MGLTEVNGHFGQDGEGKGCSASQDLPVRQGTLKRLGSLVPWVISISVHLFFVLAAGVLVWSSLAPSQRPMIIPLVNLSASPGLPLETDQNKQPDIESELQQQSDVEQPLESIDQIILSSRVDLDDVLDWNRMVEEDKPLFDTTYAEYLEISFFGSGGNARRIVFIVDASGSLIDTIRYVILELTRAIDALKPLQEFTVIFFQDEKVIEVPPFGLKRADAQTKSGVIEWIDPANHHIDQWGRTDPLPALRRALSYNPQLIYLLSDQIIRPGPPDLMIEQQVDLLAQIKRINKSDTRISTIQFMYPDPLASQSGGVGTMQLIARQTGGIYRFVSEDELLNESVGEEPINP